PNREPVPPAGDAADGTVPTAENVGERTVSAMTGNPGTVSRMAEPNRSTTDTGKPGEETP
ncbi:hypothetical protein KRX56_09355, partial [Dermabacteraceae bacterium TAE3-ERU27]|nr:hypothetical protein [Dermabacteraceae bacterium TAE3-ERU27]